MFAGASSAASVFVYACSAATVLDCIAWKAGVTEGIIEGVRRSRRALKSRSGGRKAVVVVVVCRILVLRVSDQRVGERVSMGPVGF